MESPTPTDSWGSYPSVYALGHKAIADLLLDPVIIEEKIDGSQFSFGRFNGELRCRSKGAVIYSDAPDRMFTKAVEVVKNLPLQDGWTYRAEYLMKPKHNALAYDRTPEKHLIIFDINPGVEDYLKWFDKQVEAHRIGLEAVPCLRTGVLTDRQDLTELLTSVSCLGGQRIEGVVIKNYHRFGADKKVLMGKYVSEAYKEVHAKQWKLGNPSHGDVIQLITDAYRSPARWQKAVQHLRDRGELQYAPQDIGSLMREVPMDIEAECRDEIIEKLWAWAWPKVRRGVAAGLPEWYKEQLMESQFQTHDGPTTGVN